MKTEMKCWLHKLCVLAVCSVVSFSLLILAYPGKALCFTVSNVKSEFRSLELRTLFESVADEGAGEFVVYDYEKDVQRYIKVADKFKERYETLVGDEGVSVLSEDVAPQALLDNRTLVEVTNPSDGPWCNVLKTSFVFDQTQPIKNCSGSAFMVSDRVAVTAAHCVFDYGQFARCIEAQSSLNDEEMLAPVARVHYAVISKKWLNGCNEYGTEHNFDQDFALLVFDDNPDNIDTHSIFTCESLSVSASLDLAVNNAGFPESSAESSQYYLPRKLYTNDRDGSISLLDAEPLGNSFRVDLSMDHGMSGGPVFLVSMDPHPATVGINSYEKPAIALGPIVFPAQNYACRITERLQVLVAWAESGGYEVVVAPQSPSTGIEELFPNTHAGRMSDALMAAIGA